MWTCYFGVSRFADSLRPAELLAPLADLTGHFPPSQQGLLPPSFRPSRSPSSPSDISTVAFGHLHRQDFHLLERQLASLHRHRQDNLRREKCALEKLCHAIAEIISSGTAQGSGGLAAASGAGWARAMLLSNDAKSASSSHCWLACSLVLSRF